MDGQTRFEAAIGKALGIVNNMNPQDRISLIRVGEAAEPLTSYTADQAELRLALNSMSAGQGRADWDTALTLAAGGAAGAENFSIVMISDGGIGAGGQPAGEYPAAYLCAGGPIVRQCRHHRPSRPRAGRSAAAAVCPGDGIMAIQRSIFRW